MLNYVHSCSLYPIVYSILLYVKYHKTDPNMSRCVYVCGYVNKYWLKNIYIYICIYIQPSTQEQEGGKGNHRMISLARGIVAGKTNILQY